MVDLVTWLGNVRVRDSLVVVVVTSVVVLVTWLGIVTREVEEEGEALVVVMNVVVLVIWLVIVRREEVVVEEGEALVVEVVASATSVVKEVTLQGSVLLLDCFPIQQNNKMEDEFE